MRKWLVGLILACAPFPTVAQLVNPPAISTSSLATKAEVAAVQASIPTAGTGSPTAVVDQNSGVPGAAGVYAPFNHTHPSKARKDRVQTNATLLGLTILSIPTSVGVTWVHYLCLEP